MQARLGPWLADVPGRPAKPAPLLSFDLELDVPRPLNTRGLDTRTWKRRAIWHAEARNQRIAAIAVAVVAGCRDELAALGFDEDDVAALARPALQARRVAILVESPEHGRQLRMCLRGWHLLAGPWKSDVPGQVANRAIMTLVHAGSAPDREVDVLIRAVASPDCPWPRAFPPATSRAVGGATRIEIQAPDR